MKKILKPAEAEHAVYYSDFTGKPFDERLCCPHVEVKFNFNYGSKYDCTEFNLHLHDEDVDKILDVIAKNLNEDVRKVIKGRLQATDESYQDAIDAGDWQSCDIYGGGTTFYKKILDIKV